MNYNLTDNLPDLRVGDTLTLEDGSKHIAEIDNGLESCIVCSVWKENVKPSIDNCRAIGCKCNIHEYHFVKLKL